MTEEERIAAADKAREDSNKKLDAIGDALKRMDARLDGYDATDKARKDAAEATEKEREEAEAEDRKKFDAARKDRFGSRKDGESRKDWKGRHDADEKAMADARRKDAVPDDKAREDARGARKDAEEAEGEAGGESFKKWAEGEAEEASTEDKAREDARKDAEEKEKLEKEDRADRARHDSASTSRIAALEARLKEMTTEVPAAERDALALAQSRADTVAAMFGDRASAPIPGEKPVDYRKRLLGRFQRHSARFKESRLDRLDEAMLQPIEDIVYADAVAAAKAPGVGAPGQLIAFTERDRAGRTITKYGGDIMAWMSPFMTGATVGRIIRSPKGNQ